MCGVYVGGAGIVAPTVGRPALIPARDGNATYCRHAELTNKIRRRAVASYQI